MSSRPDRSQSPAAVQTSGPGQRSLLDLLPQLRRVTAQDLEALRAVAAADDHQVVAPTHVAVRRQPDGTETIVGYASIGAIMLVNCWVDSRQVRARESASLLNVVENIAAEKGAQAIALPVAEQSPFYPHIERLGYTPLGWASYNVKVVQ